MLKPSLSAWAMSFTYLFNSSTHKLIFPPHTHTHTFLPANISQPLGRKIDGIKLLLSRFFCYQDLQASLYPPLSSTTPFHKSRFFTLQPLRTHTGARHTHTSAHIGTNVHTYRLRDMAVTRWMTSLSPAATHTQTQELRWSYTCTFWLRNGKCQSLSMAGPGNAVIPSLPPIALIIGKCHLISQVHIAWLISKKRKERETDGEMERHGICPVCFFGHASLCGIKRMSIRVCVCVSSDLTRWP